MTMENIPAVRRKKYFVNRGLQLRFARFVIGFVFFSSAFTGLTIFGTTFLLMGEKLASVYPQGRLVPIFQSVYFWAFVGLLAVLPVIFWGSIVFSHRIAGPLPKIYRVLANIGEGNFDIKLTLRKHDELRELADVINEMAKKLRERESKK
jgi:methyl-accepting chemotaxis protein